MEEIESAQKSLALAVFFGYHSYELIISLTTMNQVGSLVTRLLRPSLIRPSMQPLQPLHTSVPLESAVIKKKKKTDPILERAREERRKKRVTKALKKMSKKDRIPKPLVEAEIAPHIFREMDQRQRKQGYSHSKDYKNTSYHAKFYFQTP